MNWKLVVFILIMALVLVFIGFNLDNRCDISIVFVTFQAVPVIVTILGAYLVGLLSALVLSVGRSRGATSGTRNDKAGGQNAKAGDSAPESSARTP